MRRVLPARPTCWLMGTLCRQMTDDCSMLWKDLVLGMRPFDHIPELSSDPQLRLGMRWLEERDFHRAVRRFVPPPPRGTLAPTQAREAYLDAMSAVNTARACQETLWHFMPGLRRERPRVDAEDLQRLRREGEQDEDATEAEVLQAGAARCASDNFHRNVVAVEQVRQLAVAVQRFEWTDEEVRDAHNAEVDLLWASDLEDAHPN
jgi:hypothetical protein